jgi:hypothetical protein
MAASYILWLLGLVGIAFGSTMPFAFGVIAMLLGLVVVGQGELLRVMVKIEKQGSDRAALQAKVANLEPRVEPA